MSQQESLEELMAQFRQLENPSTDPSQEHKDNTTLSFNKTHSNPQLSAAGSGKNWFPFFPIGKQSSWLPPLILVGGMILFVAILVGVFRPGFLYSREQVFLWKRFFITVIITFLFLVGTLTALLYYARRFL